MPVDSILELDACVKWQERFEAGEWEFEFSEGVFKAEICADAAGQNLLVAVGEPQIGKACPQHTTESHGKGGQRNRTVGLAHLRKDCERTESDCTEARQSGHEPPPLFPEGFESDKRRFDFACVVTVESLLGGVCRNGRVQGWRSRSAIAGM